MKKRILTIIIIFGCGISFINILYAQTPQPTNPTVTTLTIESITSNQAIVQGLITDEGGSPIQEKGICWNTSANPDINASHAQSDAPGENIQTTISNLNSGTEYHVRAYAINKEGFIGYGENKVFTTGINSGYPSVTTIEAVSVTSESATVSGNVDSDGGSDIIEKGICWGMSSDPDTNTSCIQSNSPGSDIQITITGLNSGTQYHFRAYATSNQGFIGYGADKYFVTSSVAGIPSVTTADVISVSSQNAVLGGNVDSDGGASIVSKGICWNTLPNPDINNDYILSDAPGGTIQVTITELSPNTQYYFRAYTVNSNGQIGYGENKTFTTDSAPEMPSVTTADVISVTSQSAVLGGSISGSTVIEKGICWGTSPNPDIEGSHVQSDTPCGEIQVAINELNTETEYHFRAYAINSERMVGYGEDKIFTTDSVTVNSFVCDIDRSGDCDLRDAISVLRLLAGMNPGDIDINSDVNGDGKIGIPELIHILKKLSE